MKDVLGIETIQQNAGMLSSVEMTAPVAVFVPGEDCQQITRGVRNYERLTTYADDCAWCHLDVADFRSFALRDGRVWRGVVGGEPFRRVDVSHVYDIWNVVLLLVVKGVLKVICGRVRRACRPAEAQVDPNAEEVDLVACE